MGILHTAELYKTLLMKTIKDHNMTETPYTSTNPNSWTKHEISIIQNDAAVTTKAFSRIRDVKYPSDTDWHICLSTS